MSSDDTKITLAATWNPRGELPRIERRLPLFEAAYGEIVFSLPPFAGAETQDSLDAIRRISEMGVKVILNQDWTWGRYSAVELALESGSPWIHYADMDRLLRWIEIRPDEWREALNTMRQFDYLVIGRTSAAYSTHPQALVQTEWISNRIISHLVGKQMDVSAGSKGFSSRAARYIITHSQPGAPFGTDAEWTVLLHNAGFHTGYIEVDGLDWETADRYQFGPADVKHQQVEAARYDVDPANWEYRVKVAQEIVDAGLQAAERYTLQHPKK